MPTPKARGAQAIRFVLPLGLPSFNSDCGLKDTGGRYWHIAAFDASQRQGRYWVYSGQATASVLISRVANDPEQTIVQDCLSRKSFKGGRALSASACTAAMLLSIASACSGLKYTPFITFWPSRYGSDAASKN
jgi:hypothetical protein